jgi:lipoate-protein ligase A
VDGGDGVAVKEVLRLIFDPPAAGAWNMAVDEGLLQTAATSGVATLRFYTWEEPTLSLGYFQAAADRQLHPSSRECPMVRRASGGGAIIHDRELTYSFAWPQTSGKAGPATQLYDALHQTLVEALGEFGVEADLYHATDCSRGAIDPAAEPFLCFQRLTCGDVVCGGAKIAGSAQRRRRGAVLQHGSVLLSRSAKAPGLPGIADLTGTSVASQQLADCWTRALLLRLSADGRPAELEPSERRLAVELVSSRFGSAEFILRR